jgi:type VI secretion system protein VasD
MIPRRMLLFAIPSLLAGCGSDKQAEAPTPSPPSLELTIIGGPDQNPSRSGQPSPVAIRLYRLKGTGRFEGADVFALTDREAATLGDELAASEEIVIAPGESRTITRVPENDVQFLGVAVLFRDIDRTHWRATAPIAPHGPTKLVLKTTAADVTLKPATLVPG